MTQQRISVDRDLSVVFAALPHQAAMVLNDRFQLVESLLNEFQRFVGSGLAQVRLGDFGRLGVCVAGCCLTSSRCVPSPCSR